MKRWKCTFCRNIVITVQKGYDVYGNALKMNQMLT